MDDNSESNRANSPPPSDSFSPRLSSTSNDPDIATLRDSVAALNLTADVSHDDDVIEAQHVERVLRVGLVHDDAMLKHKQAGHPERPERISAIVQRLKEQGLYARCVRLPAEEASEASILRCHSERMLAQLQSTGTALEGDTLHVDGDTYSNKYSYRAALLAAGSVMACARAVLSQRVDAAFALVRPPGHHAEADQAMGFCLFNNTAIAAKYAQQELGCARVAILDWDVHHGNGTQHIFEKDPSILYLSVHKGGMFYPGTGKTYEVGLEDGKGFTVNCPFLQSGMRDSDYLTLFEFVFMPIVREFAPDLLIVSAGFDCAAGDLLGSMRVSSQGFGRMAQYCLDAVPGRVIFALEGGYDLTSTALGAQACVEAMLGQRLAPPELLNPSTAGLADILECARHQRSFWKCLDALDENPSWGSLLNSYKEKLASYTRPREDEPDRCKAQ